MPNVKKWGKQGANSLKNEVKELKRKTKNSPVKVYSKEELDTINAERSKKE